MKIYIIIAAIAIIFIFIIIKLFSKKIKKTKPSLHPFGFRLIYTDQKPKKKRDDVIYSKLLYSKRYNIHGKPDFLFQNKSGKIIPIELKSGTIGSADFPHKGDLLQLTAYFIIVEETYGIKPKEGRLIYKDFMFKIKNTRKLRKILFETLEEMRETLIDGIADVEPNYAKCRHCVCRGTVCEYQKKN